MTNYTNTYTLLRASTIITVNSIDNGKSGFFAAAQGNAMISLQPEELQKIAGSNPIYIGHMNDGSDMDTYAVVPKDGVLYISDLDAVLNAYAKNNGYRLPVWEIKTDENTVYGIIHKESSADFIEYISVVGLSLGMFIGFIAATLLPEKMKKNQG